MVALMSTSIGMESPSPRRAWIEISVPKRLRGLTVSSPSPRRAWIEMPASQRLYAIPTSPSPRRAGIEMARLMVDSRRRAGRPPHGGRGLKLTSRQMRQIVSSGRPPHGGRGLKCQSPRKAIALSRSPSPRRAWIEIHLCYRSYRSAYSRPPHGGRGLK